jgi:hypothetical protein
MPYKTLDHWNNILSQANNIMSLCKPYLSDETITAVQHYLDHDEYEMAIEGLFIDIMQLPIAPESLDSKTCIELAKSVELDKESVFRDDFWAKFLEFCHSKLKQG